MKSQAPALVTPSSKQQHSGTERFRDPVFEALKPLFAERSRHVERLTLTPLAATCCAHQWSTQSRPVGPKSSEEA